MKKKKQLNRSSKAVRELREKLEINQCKLARLACLKLQEVKNLELSRTNLSDRTAYQILLATGCHDGKLKTNGRVEFYAMGDAPTIETWNKALAGNAPLIDAFRDVVCDLIADTRRRCQRDPESQIKETQLLFALTCSLVRFRVRTGLQRETNSTRWVTANARNLKSTEEPDWATCLHLAVHGHKDQFDTSWIRKSLGIPDSKPAKHTDPLEAALQK